MEFCQSRKVGTLIKNTTQGKLHFCQWLTVAFITNKSMNEVLQKTINKIYHTSVKCFTF